MTSLRFPADLVVTHEHLAESGWERVQGEVACRGYEALTHAFANAGQEAIENGRPAPGKVLWLLADACGMQLRVDSTNEWLARAITHLGYWTVGPEEFTPADLGVISLVAEAATDPYLLARLHDLLWLCRSGRKIEDAWAAIEAYSQLPLDAEAWRCGARQCWERVARLALGPGRGKSGLTDQVQAKMEGAFFAASQEDWFIARDLTTQLSQFGVDARRIADKLIDLADEYDAEDSQISAVIAGTLFGMAARFLTKAGDGPGSAKLIARRAETAVREAEIRLRLPAPSYGAAAGFYRQAVEIYRTINKTHGAALDIGKRISELRTLMEEAARRSLDEMHEVPLCTIDHSEEAHAAQQCVSGKSLEEAVYAFVHLLPRARKWAYHQRAIEQMREAMPFLPVSVLASDGRTIVRVPTPNHEADPADETNKEVVAFQMLRAYLFDLRMSVNGILAPALETLLLEHRFSVADLTLLAAQSPVVPADRAHSIAIGLHAGFEFDFVTALHILAPQLEHIVRCAVKQAGGHTTQMRDGKEQESGLSSLVELPEAKAWLGDDLQFEVNTLFCDHGGPNFRNQIAHGLLSDDECQSAEAIYAWWFCLKLVASTFWQSVAAAPQQPDQPGN